MRSSAHFFFAADCLSLDFRTPRSLLTATTLSLVYAMFFHSFPPMNTHIITRSAHDSPFFHRHFLVHTFVPLSLDFRLLERGASSACVFEMPVDLARSVCRDERANLDVCCLKLVQDIEVPVYRPIGDRVAKPPWWLLFNPPRGLGQYDAHTHIGIYFIQEILYAASSLTIESLEEFLTTRFKHGQR
ncbi:hypothetical protein EDB85DRAFT_1931131 [Lactarius pseudohatsudake]|nr:hypothetical protein EDB85DRAFT_1931131 [Lactarius pseudohatsudake]